MEFYHSFISGPNIE